MAGRPRAKMSVENRAKQFMPFSALSGLGEALAKKEKIVVDKVELSEEMAEELDRKLHMVKRGEIVTVVYYHQDEYIRKTGVLARIDETEKILQIVDAKIPFGDILDIVKE